MEIKCTIKGKGIAAFTTAVDALASSQAKAAARMALNDTGRQVTTQVKRALVQQTGIKYGAVGKAIKQTFATDGNLEFRITGTGKHFGLVDFGARQGARGVSAAPWNTRRVFGHTFIIAKLGGQVFARVGKGHMPIKKLFGPSVPSEMVRDHVPVVFVSMARTILPVQVARQFARLMPK